MDSATTLEQVIKRCLEIGINCLAVADHGTISGALKLKEMAPFPIIIAEEILTPYGEIMGMFLSEEVPSKISVEETISRIKEQEGLICIPHPYDKMRLSAFNHNALENIIANVDIIEVFNSRNITPSSNAKARKLAKKFGKLASAGSDAHTPHEIGNAYIEMPEFNSTSEFLKSLAKGKIVGHRSNPLVHMISTRNKLENRFSKGDSLC